LCRVDCLVFAYGLPCVTSVKLLRVNRCIILLCRNNIRGIAISSVLAKVFEHCILDRLLLFSRHHPTSSVLKYALVVIMLSVPNALLTVLERWLSSCCSCVKWYDVWSDFFTLSYGVRHSSVLSPFLFALYLDDIAQMFSCKKVSILCYMPMTFY